MSAILGLLWTGWSAVRSSRILQYVLIGVVIVAAFLFAQHRAHKRGRADAVADAMQGVIKRMEQNREVHREIRDLPLSDRAERLRELDRRN